MARAGNRRSSIIIRCQARDGLCFAGVRIYTYIYIWIYTIHDSRLMACGVLRPMTPAFWFLGLRPRRLDLNTYPKPLHHVPSRTPTNDHKS